MTDIVDALRALVNPTTLLAFLFLIVPGTISLRVYDRLRSRQSRKITESIIDIIIVSFINDLIWSPIFQFSKVDFRNATFPDLSVAVVEILAFLVTPIILACLYAFGENILAKFGLVSDTEPRPWDKWFTTVKREKRDVAVILIMKSDHRAIAGRYIPPGFASSEPAEESIHIGQTWKIDQDTGAFVQPVDGSLGIFVQMSDVETVEFFEWSSIEKYFKKESHDGEHPPATASE